MTLPNRSGSEGSYRYGFNGKEKDDEVKGEGVQYDYGFRIYDARIGKFLSTDPLFKGYPWYTPYQFAGNKPILAVDLDGLEEYIPIPNTEESSTPKLKYSIQESVPCVDCHHNTILDPSDLTEEDIQEAKTAAVLTLTIATAGVGAELYASGRLAYGFYRLAWIASNPANQEMAVAVGGLTASLIDPNPANDYPGNLDDVARPIKYLFRGTTRGFSGGATAIKYSATYTSTDPLKATIFSTLNKAKGEAIVLIGNMKKLKNIPTLPSNRLAEMEKEVILNIQPSTFMKEAASITLGQAKSIFKEMGIAVPSTVNMQNINTILKQTKDLTEKQINTFYEKASKIIEKEAIKQTEEFIKNLDKSNN
ncbi:RHS repeat-associated core domain-containing protein [Algibacter sp. 2305UL17-15]|uniref:RHS repeat domain-containing protein n=1 Tax=Algibacter sp. 2305UL17-15 TaxID=3231268 RepID=UPI00345AD137